MVSVSFINCFQNSRSSGEGGCEKDVPVMSGVRK